MSNQCEECHSNSFETVLDSILFQRYSFIKKNTLKQCVICGAKYIWCIKCDKLISRVHISLDPFNLKSKCPLCNEINKELQVWLKKQIKFE